MVKGRPVQHRQHYAKQSILSISLPARWCLHPGIEYSARYRLSLRFFRIRENIGVVCTGYYPTKMPWKWGQKPQRAPSPARRGPQKQLRRQSSSWDCDNPRPHTFRRGCSSFKSGKLGNSTLVLWIETNFVLVWIQRCHLGVICSILRAGLLCSPTHTIILSCSNFPPFSSALCDHQGHSHLVSQCHWLSKMSLFYNLRIGECCLCCCPTILCFPPHIVTGKTLAGDDNDISKSLTWKYSYSLHCDW